MAVQTIRVSEAEDRKLWELILKHKWDGRCFDPYTYSFTTDQLQLIRKAGIHFQEISRHSASERQAGQFLEIEISQAQHRQRCQ